MEEKFLSDIYLRSSCSFISPFRKQPKIKNYLNDLNSKIVNGIWLRQVIVKKGKLIFMFSNVHCTQIMQENGFSLTWIFPWKSSI